MNRTTPLWIIFVWFLLALGGCGEPALSQEALWLREGAPSSQAIALVRALCAAESYGLRSADYLDCARFEQRATGPARAGEPAPFAGTELDTELSRAAVRFINDVHFGRTDPRQAGLDLSLKRSPLVYEQLLVELSRASDVAKLLAQLEPQFEHYRLLKAALARYRALASGQAVPTRSELRNAPYTRRIRQIELTLERWRWLPGFTTPPIIVNIPQFRLFAFRSTRDLKAEILQMDVIVGRSFADLRTPIFTADLKYIVFRPYWDVPYSITQKEMLPELRGKPDFWKKEHLELVDGQGDSAPVVPFSAHTLDLLAAGKLRLRQRPGPDNALGLIKFVLPNPYNVYLHSTPARNLFKRNRRAFSHGCIRVSEPVALAAHVLRNAADTWTPEMVTAAMNGPDGVRVNLKTPIRVLVLYGTALAQEDGTVLFFDDIYGHDRRLEALMGLPPLTTVRSPDNVRSGSQRR